MHCYTANKSTKLALSQICKKFDVEIAFQDLISVKKTNGEAKNTNVALLILDYGVESLQPVYSIFYRGGKSQEIARAGRIALNTGQIASSYANPNMRVAVVRAQNWATRELARKFFSLPLFNNYTSVLSGQVFASPKISRVQEIVLEGGVVADYGLVLKSTLDWSISSDRRLELKLIKLLSQIGSRLPVFVRNPLKRMLKWFIRI